MLTIMNSKGIICGEYSYNGGILGVMNNYAIADGDIVTLHDGNDWEIDAFLNLDNEQYDGVLMRAHNIQTGKDKYFCREKSYTDIGKYVTVPANKVKKYYDNLK